MLHEPASAGGKDPAAAYKSRLGVRMFLLYCLFYVSFVAVNLVSPTSMESIVFAGLNLATVYGFGLIIVALVQALIYDRLCRLQEARLADSTDEEAA
jgi:uncharacterized membrane protein (DUF485 family)